MEFDWDENKAAVNFKKHGVTFEEAMTVWQDYFNIELIDHKHSLEEKRFYMIGESEQNRLLVISFTERENKVRIINARLMTPKERREYEHGNYD
ncbi:MAG: BrnT family toxin [Chloracidobacterium sp.]|nr:BrnT family toxin [Chloracidobacterium sp.]